MQLNIFVEGRPDLSHSSGSFRLTERTLMSGRVEEGTQRTSTGGLNLYPHIPHIWYDCLERAESDYFFSGPNLGMASERDGLAAYESDGMYYHYITEIQLKFVTDLEEGEVRILIDGKLTPADPQPSGGRVPNYLPGFRLEARLAFSEFGSFIGFPVDDRAQKWAEERLARFAVREGKENYLAHALNRTA